MVLLFQVVLMGFFILKIKSYNKRLNGQYQSILKVIHLESGPPSSGKIYLISVVDERLRKDILKLQRTSFPQNKFFMLSGKKLRPSKMIEGKRLNKRKLRIPNRSKNPKILLDKIYKKKYSGGLEFQLLEARI